MSTINVNAIDKESGSTLTLGGSGTTVDIPSGATVTGLPSNANILVNGNFDIWQRGTSFTGVANVYTADRWFIAGGGAMDCTQQSGTSSDPFKYYLRAQRPSGQTHTNVNIGVALELADVIALRGKTLTFSCKMRKGANYSATSDAIQMSCGSNNDAADQDKSQNHVDGIASVTKTLTSSWQTFSVSHTVESDAVALVVRLSSTNVGTAGAADYFDLAQAKLELGSQTEFEPRSYGQEFALCQRYYERTDRVCYIGLLWGLANTTGAVRGNISFNTSKRASPTIAYSDVSANWSASTITASIHGVTVECGASAATTDARPGFSFVADSEL